MNYELVFYSYVFCFSTPLLPPRPPPALVAKRPRAPLVGARLAEARREPALPEPCTNKNYINK